MSTKELFLQWPSRPVCKDRVLQIQYAFVEIGNRGEDTHLHRFACVAKRLSLLHRCLERSAHLRTKTFGVVYLLALKADTKDRREHLLKRKCQAIDTDGTHQWVSMITVRSNSGCKISPGMYTPTLRV